MLKRLKRLLPQGIYEKVVPEGQISKEKIIILGDYLLWSVDKEQSKTHRVYRYKLKYSVLCLRGLDTVRKCSFKSENGSIMISGAEFKIDGFVLL